MGEVYLAHPPLPDDYHYQEQKAQSLIRNKPVNKLILCVGQWGRKLVSSILQLTRHPFSTSSILIDPDRPTVTKTRIAGHARQSVTQQIVRVDRKSDELPDSDKQLQLAEQIRQQLDTVDAVVCSDYGDGVFTPPVIEAALSHSRTIVDAQKGSSPSFPKSASGLMSVSNIN